MSDCNFNFIKQVVSPMDFRQLKEWPRKFLSAMAEW
jgi:hypothetical protein